MPLYNCNSLKSVDHTLQYEMDYDYHATNTARLDLPLQLFSDANS